MPKTKRAVLLDRSTCSSRALLRWMKANVSELTGELQGAHSLAEFGDRFLSSLVPMIGGGVAGFYLSDETHAQLKRVSAYSLVETAGSSGSFKVGEGLVGECAR